MNITSSPSLPPPSFQRVGPQGPPGPRGPPGPSGKDGIDVSDVWQREGRGGAEAEPAEQRSCSCSPEPQPLGYPMEVKGPGEAACSQESAQRVEVLGGIRFFAGSIPYLKRNFRAKLMYVQVFVTLLVKWDIVLLVSREEGECNR